MFPNGIVAGVFEAAGSHNDVGVLNLSRLTEYLEELLFPDHVMAGGLLPALFGDLLLQNINHPTITARYKAVGLGINEAESLLGGKTLDCLASDNLLNTCTGNSSTSFVCLECHYSLSCFLIDS